VLGLSAIVTDFKKNLQGSDIGSVTELALEAKKQGFTLSDLAPHSRLHNFFIKSGASENEIKTFITNVHLSNIPSEKVIEYLNQLYEVSKEESIPLDQVSVHIREKLEEKKKIESELREADAMLQNKNVNIETQMSTLD
jgi:hypothetical protein